jgi:LysR family nitrogen assimilation transcriptional regulator
MDLRHLKYFVSVAEAGSFVAASRVLQVSQPALSSRIKEIETWAGAPLFTRLARGVSLTELGQRLLPHARDVIEAMSRAESAVRGGTKASVLLGVTPTPGVVLVPRLIARSAGNASVVHFQIQQGSSDELLGLVTQGRLQAALCYRHVNVDPVITIPLYSEDLCLVGPTELVNSKLGPISFNELAAIPLVLDPRSHATRRRIDEVAFRRQLRLDVKLEIEPSNAKRAMLEGQGFSAVVPKGLYADAIRSGVFGCRPIREPTLSMTLGLVVNISTPQRMLKLMLELIQPEVVRLIDDGFLGWRLPDTLSQDVL